MKVSVESEITRRNNEPKRRTQSIDAIARDDLTVVLTVCTRYDSGIIYVIRVSQGVIVSLVVEYDTGPDVRRSVLPYDYTNVTTVSCRISTVKNILYVVFCTIVPASTRSRFKKSTSK